MTLSAKLTSLILVCVLFSACGGGGGNSNSDSSTPTTGGQTSNPTPTPGVTPEPEPPTPEPTDPPVTNPTPAPTPPPVTEEPTPPPAVTPTPAAQKTSASVSWNIPVQRVNGESLDLSEIGGYEIMYRSTGQLLFESVIVSDSTASNYLLENLDGGQYEFLIAVFDTDGLYSDFSDPALITL